jgi:hypothetical protein
MPAAKRELTKHFMFWLIYFVLIILIKHYFSLFYLPFVIGGLVGVVLPDIDHIIYAYLIKPQDLTSQRLNFLINKNEILRSVELLYETREERHELIFHSLLFQGIFFILMVWMLSSSGSLLGRGLVISFMLHLSVDQFIDLKKLGNLNNWFKNLPFRFDDKQSKIYWIISTSLILLMGVLM